MITREQILKQVDELVERLDSIKSVAVDIPEIRMVEPLNEVSTIDIHIRCAYLSERLRDKNECS